MAVPKRKVSKTRRDKRRTHDKLVAPNVVKCPQCNAPVMPHRACQSCGYYDGAKVMQTREEIRAARVE
ncbi:50S ribosomal protein L32 [Eubacteriales bacterium OttesenSCG-928-M02]|nr:50S ribosomal protein L32 [Eubacteriales bacterium OttesenSCG-928-M02]